MPTELLYAWCEDFGKIFMTSDMPASAGHPIAKGKPKAVQLMIQSTAARKLEGRYFVPGMEAADGREAKLKALDSYRNWLAILIKNGSPLKGDVAIWVDQPSTHSTEQPQ